MKRRDFFEHVGWTGAGIIWTLSGTGVLRAVASPEPAQFNFVQISDSHIGFSRPENPDVAGTLQKTVAAINAMPAQPAFVAHTGDITHLSKPAQFDDAKHLLAQLKAPVIYVPGEHDVIGGPQTYFNFFRRPDAKEGWYSFDQGGIHFVFLVNVFDFEIMGKLGQAQIDWLQRDLAAQKSSTPIVMLGHVPLYALYPKWGWTTQDGSSVLAMLRRFDHATVLSGHIHQIIHHQEGNITFASAASTAYPQPAPGTAAKPGPLQVPPDHLLNVIGYRRVTLADGNARVEDRPLA